MAVLGEEPFAGLDQDGQSDGADEGQVGKVHHDRQVALVVDDRHEAVAELRGCHEIDLAVHLDDDIRAVAAVLQRNSAGSVIVDLGSLSA